MELFIPRRPLKPMRREKKKLKITNLTVSSADLVVRVVRAFNVPVREETFANSSNLHSLQQQGTQLNFSMLNQARFANEQSDPANEMRGYGHATTFGKVLVISILSIILSNCHIYSVRNNSKSHDALE